MIAKAICVLTLTLAVSPASAFDTSANAIAKYLFEEADENKDGVITESEYAASPLPQFGGSYADIDLNVDGEVTEEEYISSFARYHGPGENA